MSCLDATFTLTPQSPNYQNSPHNLAYLDCFGAVFGHSAPIDLSSLYTTNRLFFDDFLAADSNIDYSQWINRRKVPQLFLSMDLGDFGAQKQVALIFGFDVMFYGFDGRVLVYSDAGLIKDQKLVYGDNQFLIELESVGPLYLYFIHAGGDWFFKGLSGYVV